MHHRLWGPCLQHEPTKPGCKDAHGREKASKRRPVQDPPSTAILSMVRPEDFPNDLEGTARSNRRSWCFGPVRCS
jgi:hypothetical protein